jgi:hypothetical protein
MSIGSGNGGSGNSGSGGTTGSGGSSSGSISDSDLPSLDPSSLRLHGELPNPDQLSIEQAEQQLRQVEESIDMREWNNGDPTLDCGHQQRLNLEKAYRDALKNKLGM